MGAQRRGLGVGCPGSGPGSQGGPESPQGAQRPPTRRVFPSGVLCCPRVAEGVNAASARQFWGPGARWGAEGGWLGRRQADPGAWGSALLSSLTHPGPATPARAHPRLSPAPGPLPGTVRPLTRQHPLTLWASGPVTPPPGNPGPRVLSSAAPLCGSSSLLSPPAVTSRVSADCAFLQQNSCQRQCLACSRCSVMASDPTAA